MIVGLDSVGTVDADDTKLSAMIEISSMSRTPPRT